MNANYESRPLRRKIVNEYVCARCWGPLVEKVNSSETEVICCPTHGEDVGVVTRKWAERQEMESRVELAEVAASYPQLDTRPKDSADKLKRAKALLFPED